MAFSPTMVLLADLLETRIVKEKIHPNFNIVMAQCVCGSNFETGSTKQAVKVEICSACHPFFTGTQKIVDTEGRVERFMKKYQLDKPGAKIGAARKK